MRVILKLILSSLVVYASVVMAQPVFMHRASGLLASGPETVIDSAPVSLSNQVDAVFTFSLRGGEGFGGYECSADSVTYGRCFSPYTRRSLPEGKNVFCVRGIDATGAKDATPACYEWTVDITPPKLTITSPGDKAGVPTKDPEIKGTTNEPSCEVHVFVGDKDVGSVTSNEKGDWAFSGSLNLGNGIQNLGATAKDRAGNVSGRVTISVDVSTQPPSTTIVEHPEQVERSHNAVFEFSSPSGAKQFECQLDNAPAFTPCDEVWLLKKLEAGPHTLRVRAKDIAGNVDQAPPEHTWTVDPQADITCSQNPQGGCASSGGQPTLVLSLLGGLLLVLTARRRRSP
jgi:large repetitive protein